MHGTRRLTCVAERRHGQAILFTDLAEVRSQRVRRFKFSTNLNEEAIAQRHFLMLPFIPATVKRNKNQLEKIASDRKSDLTSTHKLVCGIIVCFASVGFSRRQLQASESFKMKIIWRAKTV